MRVYVAAASSEHERALACVHQLQAKGIQVTSKAWARRGEGPDLPLHERATIARTDLAEIDACQFFLLLAPSNGHATAGVWVGLGRALHVGKFVIVAGVHSSAYVGLADEYHHDEQAAIASLVEHAKLRVSDSAHANLPAIGSEILVRLENYADETQTWSFIPNDRLHEDVIEVSLTATKRKDTWMPAIIMGLALDAQHMIVFAIDSVEHALLIQALDVDWRYRAA